MNGSPKKLPPDIMNVDLEWRIDLAKKGDGEPLAELLRSERRRDELLRSKPRADFLWDFLAGVVAGEIKLPAPRKRTYLTKSRRWLLEAAVARGVYMGKCRNSAERDYWTRKLCEAYGTTPDRVAAFTRSNRRRRGP